MRGFSLHFSLLPWNIFVISKNYRSSSNEFIQGLSAFALVTFFKMWAQFSEEADIASVELTEAGVVYWVRHDWRRCTAFLDTHWQPHYSPSLSPPPSHYLSLSLSLSLTVALSLCVSVTVCVFWEHSQSDDFGCRVLGLYNIRAKICVR